VGEAFDRLALSTFRERKNRGTSAHRRQTIKVTENQSIRRFKVQAYHRTLVLICPVFTLKTNLSER